MSQEQCEKNPCLYHKYLKKKKKKKKRIVKPNDWWQRWVLRRDAQCCFSTMCWKNRNMKPYCVEFSEGVIYYSDTETMFETIKKEILLEHAFCKRTYKHTQYRG